MRYSAYTLQKLHERAARITELIAYCEKMQQTNLRDADRYRKSSNRFMYVRMGTIKHHVKEAWRCRRIANYLKRRYFESLTKITA